MIRITRATCLTLSTFALLLFSPMFSPLVQAQFASPGNAVVAHYRSLYNGQPSGHASIQNTHASSVIDQYQNLYGGQMSSQPLISAPASAEITAPYSSNFTNSNFASHGFAQPQFAQPVVSEPVFDSFVQPQFAPTEIISEPAPSNFVPAEFVSGQVQFQPNLQPAVQNDILDTRKYSLLDYRRMFSTGRTPEPHEMVGYWRGVNKGIVELVGYRQFIKEILPDNNGVISGDNIKVGQINQEMLRCLGWQPVADPQTGEFARQGKFAIQPPRGKGAFKNGATFNYRDGNNRRTDPANLLVDKVVMLDANHMLGRATANFGPVQIPLAYFVLERIQ